MRKLIGFLSIALVLSTFTLSGAVGTKISAMPAATTVGGTDIIPIVQGGVNKGAPASLFTGALNSSDLLNKIKAVDGTGSGLDADMVGGIYPSGFATSAQGTLATNAQPLISTGTTSQYWRGDKSWQTLPTSLPASDVYSWAKAVSKPAYTYTEVGSDAAGAARPASDVSAWAKAGTKPSYTKSEVGLGSVDDTSDATKSVNYAATAAYAPSAGTAISANYATTAGSAAQLAGRTPTVVTGTNTVNNGQNGTVLICTYTAYRFPTVVGVMTGPPGGLLLHSGVGAAGYISIGLYTENGNVYMQISNGTGSPTTIDWAVQYYN